MVKMGPDRRAIVRHVPGGVRVVIPARRSWIAALFLPVWLLGWGLGEVAALRELLRGQGTVPFWFLLLWLVLWTLGGLSALAAFAYGAFGREVIEVVGGTLRVRREALGIGRTRAYAAHEVRSLRVAPAAPSTPGVNPWSPGDGRVAFEHGARTVRMAAGVGEAEAERLAELLRARLPGAVVDTQWS